MNWKDRALSTVRKVREAIIEREKPELVTHDRLDESVCDDFRRKARKFDATFRDAPEVPATLGADEQADETLPNVPWKGWEDLMSQMFCAHHTYDEPIVAAEGSVMPSEELSRRLVERMVGSDEFRESRPDTRHSALASAMATKAAGGVFKQSFDEELREHLERMEEMRRREEELQQAQQAAAEAAANGNGKGEAAANAVADAAAKALGQLMQQQAEANMATPVAQAVDKAAQAAKDASDAAGQLPGAGPGSDAAVSAEQALELAERWNQARMKKILELVGRLAPNYRYARSHRVQGGREEIVGVEIGNDLSRVLPSELLKLAHPLSRLQFYRQFHERELLQFEMVGTEQVGKGPVVLVVDGSSSMTGGVQGVSREVWARAVGIVMVEIAHKERRPAAIVEFGSGGQVRHWEFPANRRLDPMTLLNFAESFYNGGTDTTLGMKRADKIMREHPNFSRADIVLVTDGEDYFDEEEDLKLRDSLRGRGVRILGIGIGGSFSSLMEWCDEGQIRSLADLDMQGGANEATDFIASHIS